MSALLRLRLMHAWVQGIWGLEIKAVEQIQLIMLKDLFNNYCDLYGVNKAPVLQAALLLPNMLNFSSNYFEFYIFSRTLRICSSLDLKSLR